MSATADAGFIAGLLAARVDGGGPLARLRAQAVERAAALNVPTTRDEDWRFTDLAPLTRVSYRPAQRDAAIGAADLARFALPEAGARLVFVDGVYAPQWSTPLAGAVTVTPLAAAPAAHAAAIEAAVGRIAACEHNAFTALNAAFLTDGALVHLAPGAQAERPLHLLFVATQPQTANYPRCLVLAGAHSAATVIEDYVALAGGPYLTDAVAELDLGEGARLTHVRVQREAAAAFHIGHAAVALARDAHYAATHLAFGARLSRFDLDVAQRAEGAACDIGGLALVDGERLADTHSSIDHTRPAGESRQRHKCIVGGAGRAVFNGRIVVRPGAQQTNSAQSSRNLLLSPRARVDTKPQLEIFADDVKCAHGATVGQLDAEAVFYLKSRGLAERTARGLLTYAFGAEIVEAIAVPSLRRALEAAVLAQTEAA